MVCVGVCMYVCVCVCNGVCGCNYTASGTEDQFLMHNPALTKKFTHCM